MSQARGSSGRPLPGGREQGLLDGVLACLEVAAAPQQRGQDVRRLVAPHVPTDLLGHCSSAPGHIAGRSSIVSPGPANRAAISSARARSWTSIMKNPANCSFVSA